MLRVKEAETAEFKKIKHREVERVRHAKLQKLIKNLANIVPDDSPSQNTQCAILRKSLEYIEFLASEYERIAENIGDKSYSSSQETVTSSQKHFVNVENYQVIQRIICDVNSAYDVEKFTPFPSSSLSHDPEYFEYNPSFTYEWKDQSLFPSPPSSPPSLLQEPPASQLFDQFSLPSPWNQKLENGINVDQPHCQSCSCFSNKHNFPRDHFLNETIQDPYIMNNEPNITQWTYSIDFQ
ncbi:uncharacterized protein LOC128387303 [Panonychus citri]|uniref:uncharacterized protein LOC128387303 n=1 Tax=Panonychus citri TaxID=50023 RepID=UPI002307CED3|nr:uncharacterized protein LOC128387303 [Panonychus citri]